jgi:hypothetical protein
LLLHQTRFIADTGHKITLCQGHNDGGSGGFSVR